MFYHNLYLGDIKTEWKLKKTIKSATWMVNVSVLSIETEAYFGEQSKSNLTLEWATM